MTETPCDNQAKQRLIALAAAYPGDAEPPPEVRAPFDPGTPQGRSCYESFTDEELLDMLRQAAERLGRSPAQKELFCVYRSYIRQRFGKWPYALQRAGLSKSAGVGGVRLERHAEEVRRLDALLARVREKAAEMGRTPHPSELPEVCAALQRHFDSWGDVLEAAGVKRVQTVHRIPDLEPRYLALLEELTSLARTLNRAPLRSEAPESLRGPLVERCGSWRNTLFQVGLEPVTHIASFSSARLDRSSAAPRKRHSSALQDCYYRVLALDEETRADLALVENLAGRLHRPPKRGDVPPEVRRRLQTACGSWSNALYQLGLKER